MILNLKFALTTWVSVAQTSVGGFPIDLGELANPGLRLIVAGAGGLGIASNPHRLKSVLLKASSSTH
jgi:hypothetical protein